MPAPLSVNAKVCAKDGIAEQAISVTSITEIRFMVFIPFKVVWCRAMTISDLMVRSGVRSRVKLVFDFFFWGLWALALRTPEADAENVLIHALDSIN